MLSCLKRQTRFLKARKCRKFIEITQKGDAFAEAGTSRNRLSSQVPTPYDR